MTEPTHGCTRQQPRATGADALDRAAHALIAASTSGLSPASALLAWIDWAVHLAVSPGKNMALAAQAAHDWMNGLPERMPGCVARGPPDRSAGELAVQPAYQTA